LSHLRFLAVLLALCVTAGCKAQTDSKAPSDAVANRRIEVTIRSQFNIPQDYDVAIGTRKPSNISGFQELPVTVSKGTRSQTISFLISTDGKKLARLETYDLTRDPASGIDLTGRPVRGNPDAKVTVINFDDLECPYCARMHQQLFPATKERYGDKVRFVYKDFPLVEIHPWAMRAAINANCLADQSHDVYWNFVDYLHTHSQEVTGEDRDIAKSNAALDRIAREHAAAGKLDAQKLDACIAKQDDSRVKDSLKEAASLGLEGAPALFVNGERINGAVPVEQVWMAIDRALRAEGVQPPAWPSQPSPPAQPSGAAKTGGGN
jgi:protein-disulfide isomerase